MLIILEVGKFRKYLLLELAGMYWAQLVKNWPKLDEILNMNVAGFVETNMFIIQLIMLWENIMEI